MDDLDALGQAELVRSGQVTALELVDAAIARIERTRELNAVIWDRFELARAEAEAVTPGAAPLAGVPFLLKELGASLTGAPERMGSRALRDRVATHDAWTVHRYREAGLIVCGTTNTPEWGNHCTTEPLLTGPTVNPWAPDRTPGGSSGGSAVAVATGLVPAASGGDGTGSIRVSAACCGVVGLKPRRARKSFAPDGGHGLEGLASEHVLTRTVRDCAALLDLTAGTAPGDPYTAPPPAAPFAAAVEEADRPPLRVLMSLDPPLGGVMDHEVRAAVERTGRLLADLGHHVDSGPTPVAADAVTEAVAVLHGVSNAELHALATLHLGRSPTEDEFETSTWQMVREGFEISGEGYAGAIATVHQQGRRFAEAVGANDVLLVPTLLTQVPGYGVLNQPRSSVFEFFAVEFATTGWTAPDEAVLLRLAGELERAVSFARSSPR